jgi:hypothetical protein
MKKSIFRISKLGDHEENVKQSVCKSENASYLCDPLREKERGGKEGSRGR